MSGCGAELEANALFQALTAGDDFTIPVIDVEGPEFEVPGGAGNPMYDTVTPLEESSLTSRQVGGTGMFDGLMVAFSNHLKAEYEKNRITGADYTKTYIALSESALSGAVSYLLGKDQAYWQAQTAQVNAITAKVQLEIAKVQLAALQFEALNQQAQYALTKMKLSTESVTYCTAQYNLDNILPQQKLNLIEQGLMLTEQKEAQRAQTMDTRSNGDPVLGVLGKQKELYGQQITSYIRDSEIKAAKPFVDAWITMKTMDEGLIPPPCFTNESVDEVMQNVKANNNLD